nr:16S rRNA (guanine(966)-N(2))-methyltransferase RsmD [uncultured Anaeromusa sp.]
MRIITGSAKGKRLKALPGLKTRPTTDRVKESLFSIIQDFLSGAHILDLFAGTGNLGLEALSRGAAHAIFVDQAQECNRLIRENAVYTNLSNRCDIWRTQALAALARCQREHLAFDIIFCDPPYNQGHPMQIIHFIDENPTLLPNGILILEHSQHEAPPKDLNHLELRRQEQYGETMLSFYKMPTHKEDLS